MAEALKARCVLADVRWRCLLAPLAFLSPRIIAAIVDGTAPADLTVTGLAKALPYSWAEQERTIGLSWIEQEQSIGLSL
jgi:hypothetical protein